MIEERCAAMALPVLSITGTADTDPFSAIRRMSLTEKIEFFS